MGDSETLKPQEDLVKRWLEAARAGEREATEALCMHFEPEIRAYIERKMGARARRWDDPEDLTQEVLSTILGTHADLPEGMDEDHLRGRLLRTAQLRIHSSLRTHKHDQGASVMPPGREELAGESHTTTHREQRELILALVGLLPDTYREIVRLCALEELPFVEVARRLDMHEDTVRKRYDKARAILELKLRERRNGR